MTFSHSSCEQKAPAGHEEDELRHNTKYFQYFKLIRSDLSFTHAIYQKNSYNLNLKIIIFVCVCFVELLLKAQRSYPH